MVLEVLGARVTASYSSFLNKNNVMIEFEPKRYFVEGKNLPRNYKEISKRIINYNYVRSFTIQPL